MFDMIFSFQGRDVGPSKSAAAIEAQKIESAKIIRLAEWILASAFFVVVVNGKKLRSYDLSAVLDARVSITLPST